MKSQRLSKWSHSNRTPGFGWIVAAAILLAVLQTRASGEAGWRHVGRPVANDPGAIRERATSRFATTAWPVHNAMAVSHASHRDIKPIQYYMTDSVAVHLEIVSDAHRDVGSVCR